jgi:hypothetical protein
MRWPFVTRGAYEQLKANRDIWQTMCVQANAARALAEKRYYALADKVTERAQPIMPERKKDDLAEIIAMKAGTDLGLRKHLSAWAQAALRAGKTPLEVQNEILHWKADEDAA